MLECLSRTSIAGQKYEAIDCVPGNRAQYAIKWETTERATYLLIESLRKAVGLVRSSILHPSPLKIYPPPLTHSSK